MNMKFNNGTIVTVEGLTEQRVGMADINWVMMFGVTSQLSKEDLEILLTENNISSLEITDGENTKVITGYNKITVATMRYLSDLVTITEVQLRK